MDIRKIKKLIELLEESGLAEIEVHEGKESVRISRNNNVVMTQPAPMMMAPQQIVANPAPSAAAPVADNSTSNDNEHAFTSPMIGTFYRAASPSTPSFAEVGQTVSAGDTLCIIEAMKMFNEIECDRSGTIKSILIENGVAVEFGEPLFIIE